MLRQRALGSEKGCRRGWPAIYLVNRQASRQLCRNASSEYKMGQEVDKVSRGGRYVNLYAWQAGRTFLNK
jgi:hypothetical protein